MLSEIVKLHDENGRFVIPIGIRKKMRIAPTDLLSIETDGNIIIIKKCADSCIVCNSEIA